MEFIKSLDDYLELNTSSDTPFIICGDLNINTKEDNLMIKNYRNVISSNGFELEAEQATRITEKTSTCLDHCFHQNLFESSFELLEHENISDHLPILLKWKTKYILCDNASQFTDTSFLKIPDLVNNYLECLKNIMNQAYDEIQTGTDLNQSFEIFKKHFENCLNIYAPMKHFNIVPKNCPKWFDNRLKNLRVRRNRAFSNLEIQQK